MASFLGGSAWAMAQQIGEGFVLVNERTFKPFQRPELDKLAFEIDKALREVRAEQVSLDDIQAIQGRQRRMGRLQGALSMLRAYQARLK